MSQVHLVIWGTDVNVQETKYKFAEFLQTFVDDLPEGDSDVPTTSVEPFYMACMEEVGDCPPLVGTRLLAVVPGSPCVCSLCQINTLEEPFLALNCAHLKRFSPELYGQLVRYPQEVVPILDMAANEVFASLYPDTQLEHQIQVRTYNAEQTKNMRLLNPEDIDQLITVSGMVIRLSPLMPEMRMGEQ